MHSIIFLLLIVGAAYTYYCSCRESESIERHGKGQMTLQQKRRHERLNRVSILL